MKKRLLTEVEFYTIKAERMGYVLKNKEDYKIFVSWYDEQESKKQEQQYTKKEEKIVHGKAVITPVTITYVDFEDNYLNDNDTANHESLILSLF